MTGPISMDGARNSRAVSGPNSLKSPLLAASMPEQGGICFPREDPFASVAKETSRTAPERTPIEPSLLPEEDEYFSFEI